jgi:hypothetical protein
MATSPGAYEHVSSLGLDDGGDAAIGGGLR